MQFVLVDVCAEAIRHDGSRVQVVLAVSPDEVVESFEFLNAAMWFASYVPLWGVPMFWLNHQQISLLLLCWLRPLRQ